MFIAVQGHFFEFFCFFVQGMGRVGGRVKWLLQTRRE